MYPTKHETKKKKEAASTASFLDISLNFDKKKQCAVLQVLHIIYLNEYFIFRKSKVIIVLKPLDLIDRYSE
jgi:adenine-specific DNA methylase